jgi:hypothetical protein
MPQVGTRTHHLKIRHLHKEFDIDGARQNDHIYQEIVKSGRFTKSAS